MISSWDGLDEAIAIADTGSFVAAAARLGASPSHVSRAVARLEARVGMRIFERTTRSVRLTDGGRSLIEQFRRILQDREEAFQLIRTEGEMRGDIRITCSTALGERFIAPIVHRFIETHPNISVTMELTNRIVDLVAEGFDIGIRTGHPSDSRLAARQIASRSVATCAAPSYLARAGVPLHPSDLEDHECLIATNPTWQFKLADRTVSIVPSGRLRSNSGATVTNAALAGMGICHLPTFYLSEPLSNGTLTPILETYADAPEPIWAVFPQRRFSIRKISALIQEIETRMHNQIP